MMETLSKQPHSLTKAYPAAGEKLIRLFNLYSLIKDKNLLVGQEIIAQHILQTAGHLLNLDTAYSALTSAIKAGKGFLSSLVHEFVPELLRSPFTSDGVSTPTDDPLELLKMIFMPPGCKNFRLLRSFEANLFWHLGWKYLLMQLQEKPLEAQMRDLTLWLENALFLTEDEAQNQREVILCPYEPKNESRFSASKIGCPTIPFPVFYRLAEVPDGCGKTTLIKIIYESRIKQRVDRFRKLILSNQSEIPFVSDSCAITLVCFSQKQCLQLMEKLRQDIFNNGAALTNIKTNGNGGKDNSFSSGLSEPEKKFRVFVRGGLVECQIMLFENFFNRRLSLGPENHHLYRLKQVEQLFPLFFPSALYGVDWGDEEIQQRLYNLQRYRIMANYLMAA